MNTVLDCETIFKMIKTLKNMKLANVEDIAACISILLHAATVNQINQFETDYDDYH